MTGRASVLAQELADTLASANAAAARARRAKRTAVGLPDLPVDRASDRWARIRGGCCHAAGYIDLDRHADHVWLAVESFLNATGPGDGRSDGGRIAGARQETS